MRTCGIILLLLVQSYAVLAQHKWSPFAKLPDLGWYAEGGVNTMHIAEKQAWLGGVK